MSSRFPPVHESRYPPRARSRSPPRYEGWRPNGPPNPGFNNNNNNNRHGDFGRGLDPPRGPRTFNDSPRGPPPGPGTGSSAPLGPRGRGAPIRTEFRELRDAPPLGTDRSFRERELDRRPRPTSPRPRSPVRGFRDGPIPPRDLDLGRGRRDSRDGPISAGPGYSDAPPFGQPPFGRGGFNSRGRGRGRGDFGFRGDRRGPVDDRNTFRPRDRSPPPTRWGSVSRGDRDDWRPERREDDRWLDRDDREREPDRFRRDPIASRFDSRPPTPHQQAPSAQPPADRAPPFESSRDDLAMRRPSTTSLSGVKEPLRRDLPPQNAPPPMPLPPNDLLAGRVESSAARYGSRASSPPPSAPQVPAFGSLSFKPQPYSGPTSNVWKASPENRAPATPAKPLISSPPAVKIIPTAPKAQLAAPPPAAPRAPRALENAPPTAPRETLLDRAPSVPNSRISSAPQPPAPTGPWALRTDDRSDGQFGPATTLQGRRLSGSFQPDMNNAPTSPRTSGPPVAQMAQMTPLKPLESLSNQMPNSQTQPGPGTAQDGRAPRPDMAPPRLGTPPPTAPSGPRNTHTFSTSPVMQNPNIPTAPKAIRGPPMAPRASLDRGQPPHRPMERNGLAPPRVPPGAPRASAWNQWIRPGAPQYREPSVPAKRDSNGDEKTKQFMPRTSPQTMNRQVSDPSSMRVEEVKNDRAFRTAPVSPERRLSDANAVNNPPFQREYSVPSPAKKPESDPAVDVDVATAESSEDSFSDEEGMDLDEQDFAQSKAKFERQRAHLASQMINLNARQYRATTPLAQISRLANITVQDLPPAPSSTIAEINDDVMEGMETSDVPARAASPLHPLSPTPRKDAPTDLIIPKKEQIEEPETVTIPPVHTTYKQPEPDRVLESAEVDQDEDIDMDGSEDLDFITPEPKRNIEATITLPFLAKTPLTPLSDLGAFHENIARLNAAKPALIMHYQAQAEEEQIVQKDLQEEYVEKYRAWKLETQLLDRERASKETEERQMSVELGLDIESSPIMENPISESSRSRLHKFSSEYDIQQVLKQSEETARLEQEKSDRESRRAQIDLEKEAIAPDMWDEASKEKRIFKNMNRFRDPICLTDIYGYEPEFESFTEAEDKRFVELFKERPKQWGEIAAQLPGRSYTDCIHHYYKYKWDGRFKEKQKRKAKGGARRGGKTGRAKPATLMSDLRKDGEEDSSSGPMLTETGRPRRAATRTAYTAEKEPEVKPVAGAATVNKKVPAPGEVVPEKPAKRRKTTAAGDKPQKRGRQTLVSTATSVTSPAGTEKEVILSQEDFARAKQLEEAALLTGIYTGTRALGGPQHVEYAHDPLPIQVTNDAVERTRAPAQTSMQRSSASSYWSVPEQTDFVKFIAHFGTDFGAIANHMGTKTQTMVCTCYLRPTFLSLTRLQVKNYYQRLVESGNRPDVVDAANGANARRDRGEDMGIPPTPTPINKRRYDNPGPTLPRTASGSQGEVMDIDPIPSTQPSSLAQPSSQFQHQYRFSMITQPTSAPPQRAAPTPLQPHGSPALGKSGLPTQPRASISSSSGPKMGFFSESRMERRPTLPGSERTAQQPSPSLMHQQQPTPPGLMHQNLSHLTSEFVKNLKEEQERALSIQKRASQEHVPQVVQHSMFQPPAAQTSAPTGSPQLSMLERPLERDERAGTPGVPTLAHPRAGPGMFRNILGSPGPIQSPAVNMHPPFRSAHVPSPPKREEQPMYRPGSVPVPSPATSVVKPAGSLASGPPAEPRKTSNLASLLNSEPEEPRQKKRIGEQATPFAQSPTPSTLSVGPSGPGSSIFARRDVFNQTPVSRQEYDGRSSYSQPTSHAPTPAAQHDLMTGRSGTPVGSRQPEWQSRPPMGHNVTSSSPHPPAPLERDVRPYYSHRANLGSLNPQSRANPSPPPNTHPYMNHSRTPSVSGRPMTPSQLQPQGPSGLSHMTQAQPTHAQSQIMQSNPYPQQHGGPSHMQQIQAHQQNQFSHRHNSSGGSSHSGLHQRQTSRGEEMTMLRQQQQQQQQQEREFHMSREREHRMEVDRQYKEREAQFHQHQQQQEQQRYTQHRTPQPFQQQSLSGPPPQILSMREQARIEADQSYRDARNREQYEQEMHIRRIQEDEERMRYDYRNPNGMIGRNSGGGYGGGGAGFPPPGPHRR
jgi:serine/arginine repetitive matrix protein 2